MNKQELIEKMIQEYYMTFEQLQGLDIEQLQDTYIVYAFEDLNIEWQQSISYHGFIGSFEDYLQGLLNTERDLNKVLYALT